jgi:hypothetical protein
MASTGQADCELVIAVRKQRPPLQLLELNRPKPDAL